MQDFRNLTVWQDAHALVLRLYRLTEGFPSSERFGLASQLQRSAASIPANLAEGSSRGSDADFARFVQYALGSAAETRYHLLLAFDLGWISEEHYESLDGAYDRIGRRLNSLRTSLLHRRPARVQ